ncbi:hypothetical protein, variant [Aphanomyces invadans]|uniref:Peptidase M24 domain-containing protein n=1 Tax=Aphanomyces invadans TaxID=157072 RepID=A0A024UHJ2_9STRA|nr:hypothetical protein, variant [Aphanomyces invadans]ETW05876.1 hypothetical protein, variant [Aphanomyces invadans]|eukprot:XP_008865653.1 hypothetical protein, variant [Aphanomyces invadans]
MPSPPYYAAFMDGSAAHDRQQDFLLKVHRVRALLVTLNAAAGVLSLAHNFAWITGGGRSHIFHASEGGVGSIYVDATHVVLITNNIEAKRLLNEELSGLDLQVFEEPWQNAQNVHTVASTFAEGGVVLLDMDSAFDNALAPLRQVLTPLDIRRYRQLGRDCSAVLSNVSRSIARPGLSEWAIAAAISQAAVAKGIDVVVLLVAADDRVDAIRHPLPTTKIIQNKVMLVLCGRRGGLIASLTRLVHFSQEVAIPEDLRQRHDAVTFVDAMALSATASPSASSSNVFRAMQGAYAVKGFANEWTFHHQGGSTGYKSREWKASPTSTVQSLVSDVERQRNAW